MDPPPYFPPFHPLQPPPPASYHPLQPPPPAPYHPLQPPPAAPNSFYYPFDLPHPPPSSSASASTTATTGASAALYSDIPSAVSALTSLLQLTRTTLDSISHFLPTPRNSSASLLPCPFNPNHLIPPSSLFSHYLSCPSSKCPLSSDYLLHSLQYPHTLSSSATNLSTQPLEIPNSSDLCFSLEKFLSYSNNFFYSDCPGPVRVDTSDNDTSDSPPMLTLPRFLYDLACTQKPIELPGIYVESIKLLPSEIWAVREEMNSWGDYPASYSCRALRIILRLRTTSFSSLLEWIIMNSPNYGVIIDLAMADHIVLLFKLCLKAIITEAYEFASSFLTEEVLQELCGKKREFNCPVLTSALRWLGFQLYVLYGESKGKLFTINILKQCVLDSAWNSSVFPMSGEPMESSMLIEVRSKLEIPIEKTETSVRRVEENGKGTNNWTISVSQVAAAAAALHERSWLERKIKALRDSQLVPAYHRMVEHEYISKRAFDERQKRPDYRPVVEHDGLLLHQTQNQEPNKIKTREEILAEERDYKRRRMSYRGKKMKRSTTQVMRDIIDEFMDQIKQATNPAKEVNEVLFDNSLDVVIPGKYQSTFGASSVDSYAARRHDHGSTDYENKYLGKDKQLKHNSQHHHKVLKNENSINTARHDGREYSRSPDRQMRRIERSIYKDRHDRKEYFRSSYRQNSPSHSQRHKTNEVITDRTNEKISQNSDKSCSMSYGQKNHHREEREHYSESRDKYRKKKHERRRSTSSHIEFKDRYVPSSHGTYENDA